jgi:hypothetical protein
MVSKNDIINNMSQSELLTRLSWNSVKAFITTSVIITAFIKLMDLMGFYGYNAGLYIIISIVLFIGVYYYFWKFEKKLPYDMRLRNDEHHVLTWRDFFYTTKIDSADNIGVLLLSWFIGQCIYGGLAVLAYIMQFCMDNNDSEITMSTMRILLIGIVTTAFYIYTQRNNLKLQFWSTVMTCTAYGFGLSITAYILGMIIGISNMVFGVPITCVIIAFQLIFTALYTYIDLLEWSRGTHIIVVDTVVQHVENVNHQP